MVPISTERRHRLHPDEVPEVLEGLKLRLLEHLRTEEDLEGAATAFRAFYRMMTHQVGRPNYPEPVIWYTITEWIHFYRMERGV